MTTKRSSFRVPDVAAKQVLADYLDGREFWKSTTHSWHYSTLHKFVGSMVEPGQDGQPQLVLDETRLLKWMREDVAGRSAKYASERLAAVCHYLEQLKQAGMTDTNLLTEFKVRHGDRGWRSLAQALQSANPAAALTTLIPSECPPGPLREYVTSYIDLGRALGKKYKHQHQYLLDLDAFLASQGVASLDGITHDMVRDWLDAMTCSVGARINKARFVHRFFAYLQSVAGVQGNPADAVLACYGRHPKSSFRPYIFSKEQLATVFAAAKRLPANGRFPLRAETCYTALAICYSLGLRNGEVRRLRVADLNFKHDTLFIRETKFYKSRYVPFGPKLRQCLQEFLDVRRTILTPLKDDDPVFVSCRRAPLQAGTLLRRFRELLTATGSLATESSKLPRLHDLRHSFAVHRLLRWYREGVDLQSKLSRLATFMGHLDPQSTQVYLTITQDLLSEADSRFHKHFGSAFDEEMN
jgi:integrase